MPLLKKYTYLSAWFLVAGLFSGGLLWAAPLQLKVSGNQLVTASGGCTFHMKGVDVSGLEYSTTGDGDGAPTTTISGVSMTDYPSIVNEAITVWGANYIRLPLNQDYWMGCNGANQTAYQGMVRAVVNACSQNNAYVILDLHWSGTYSGTSASTPCSGGGWSTSTSQQAMPDWNSEAFWTAVASTSWIENNPAVFFDLYNEPYDPSGVDTTFWNIWKNGGATGSTPSNTPGMQNLVNTIRATGANNVIVAGGLNYAYDLKGLVGKQSGSTTHYNLTDTASGNGIVYATHWYPYKASGNSWTPAAYAPTDVDQAAAVYPVIVTEFGEYSGAPDTTGAWDQSVITYFLNHTGYVGGSAWAFSPDVGPTLLTSWSGFTPSAYHGVTVRNWLETPVPTCPTGATNSPTPTPTVTVTFTKTQTSSPTITSTLTATLTATPTQTTAATATPTATLPPTLTTTATLTFTASPTPTPTRTRTFTATPTLTPTITLSPTITATANASYTDTGTPTQTLSPTVSATPTSSPSATVTSSNTPTATSSPTASLTVTVTLTPTPPALTATPTASSTPTVIFTSTPSATGTPTMAAFGGTVFEPPYPNPSFGGPVTFLVNPISPSTVKFSIFTTSFRKLLDRPYSLSSGGKIVWDLCDKTEVPVANGVYYARLEVMGDRPETKIWKILVLK